VKGADGKFKLDNKNQKIANPNFIQEYFAEISQYIYTPMTIIIVSTHEKVRQQLVAHNWWFALAYPKSDENTKKQWLARINKEQAGQYKIFSEKWEEWVGQCSVQLDCLRIALSDGEGIAKHFRQITTEASKHIGR
jgi:hypothetical protein